MTEASADRREQMFPRLTPAQLTRLGDLGKLRAVERGEILYDQGVATPHFYVVKAGALEIVEPKPAVAR